jgi:hypothetical protein
MIGILKLMPIVASVYWTAHRHAGQTLSGVYFDGDNHPLQPEHGAGVDLCEHKIIVHRESPGSTYKGQMIVFFVITG